MIGITQHGPSNRAAVSVWFFAAIFHSNRVVTVERVGCVTTLAALFVREVKSQYFKPPMRDVLEIEKMSHSLS
jgi:hypothetical protein